jgi:hypothetical protein
MILIKDSTLIRASRSSLEPENLKLGDRIVVIGTPNTEGYIQASLIRIIQGNN